MRNETYKDNPKRIQRLKDAVRDLRIAHHAIQMYQTDLTNPDVENLRDVYSRSLDVEGAVMRFIDEYTPSDAGSGDE